MGGSRTTIQQPDPIDPGAAMGEYLFGESFSSYGGVTDPRLQERLLGAESTYRPRYTALELADIATMARGIEGGAPNIERQRLDAELAGLRAGAEVSGNIDTEALEESLRQQGITVLGKAPPSSQGRGKNLREYNKRLDEYVQRGLDAAKSGLQDTERATRIAQLESQISQMPETMGATPGLFDLLEEQSARAGELQREQLGLQRESDVAALQEFAPQVVEAYREADPYSTRLADIASERAGEDLGLSARGREMLGSGVAPASEAELALARAGLEDVRSDLREASEAELALAGAGLKDIRSDLRKASDAELALAKTGETLADLTPTEQEALLSKSGIKLADLTPTEQEALLQSQSSEFLKSTGELTPLERRRAEQQARAASVARGRGMDQSAIYGEMQSRMAEELGKREREISLGSQLAAQEAALRSQRIGQGAGLLGQQASMAAARIGQGGQFLQAGEALAAQRRLEQMQRQQLGAGLLGQTEALSAQRRLEQMQRQQLGAGLLGQTEALAAQRRLEQMQRQQLGASLIGQEESYSGQRLGQAFQMQRGLAGDVGMTILGRPSSAINLGGQMLGQAQQGAAEQMGPQLFDYNAGINMAMQQRSQDINLMGAQAQADASRSAGLMGGLGSIGGGLLGNTSLFSCWVAREVYGVDNPKWLQFREWMLEDSPSWFRSLYIRYGERFAKFISNKPLLKTIIRKWMNTRIK